MDKILTKNIVITLLSIVALFSCSRKEESLDFVILYTTDVHGNVLPYDFNREKQTDVSLANASTLIKEVTNEYGKKLLLIDGGDFFQGTPSMYYYNYYSTDEDHLICRVANYLEYDALVAGNHDLETGGAFVDKLNTQMPKTVRMAANIINTKTHRARYRPYKIYERDGFKICLLAMITPETGEQIPRGLIPFMDFKTMVSNTKRWVNEIQQNEAPDYMICVAHAGLKDFEIITEENDTLIDGIRQIVDNVPGIDLLLFGHDHGVYADKWTNQWGDTVNVLQPAAYAGEIGRIDVHLVRTDSIVKKTTTMERIDLKNIPADEEYIAKFSGVIDTVNTFLDRPLGYLNEGLDMVGTLYKQTNTMDIVHAIQLDATDADISLSSALSTFIDLPAGPITNRTVFKLYKYDNQLHKIWMKGEEVKAFLEYGYERQFGLMKNESSHLLGFIYDKSGKIVYARFGPELITPQYNFTSAAGINYEVDVRKPAGNRVNIISMADGTPFDMQRQYTVALSSYQAAGGGGFITRGVGWSQDDIAYHTLSISKKTISKLISEYFASGKHLGKTYVGSWKVLPEEWAERMGRKDAELLLPYIRK